MTAIILLFVSINLSQNIWFIDILVATTIMCAHFLTSLWFHDTTKEEEEKRIRLWSDKVFFKLHQLQKCECPISSLDFFFQFSFYNILSLQWGHIISEVGFLFLCICIFTKILMSCAPCKQSSSPRSHEMLFNWKIIRQ